MKIIEYFNFTNKPLSKEEKLNINTEIDKFIELYNNHNESKDVDNPILTTDDLHSKINLKAFCTEIVTKGIGKVLYTTINDTFIYTIILDIGQCFNHEGNRPAILRTLKALSKNSDFKKERNKNKNSK